MNNKPQVRRLATLAVVALAALAAVFWFGQTANEPEIDVIPGDTVGVYVAAVRQTDTVLQRPVQADGALSALAALEQAARSADVPLAVRTYDFGQLVVSIGGITAGDDGHWTYTVNGEFMPVAAGQCVLADGDTLVFHFGRAPADSL